MIGYAAYITLALLAGALLLNLYRLVFGPEDIDRVLALDTLYINAIGLFVVIGIVMDTTIFFEAGLLIAMMGFLGTVALCKYFLRGDIIE
jgi:multicomponent K+:H+ antiporter subunit F